MQPSTDRPSLPQKPDQPIQVIPLSLTNRTDPCTVKHFGLSLRTSYAQHPPNRLYVHLVSFGALGDVVNSWKVVEEENISFSAAGKYGGCSAASLDCSAASLDGEREQGKTSEGTLTLSNSGDAVGLLVGDLNAELLCKMVQK